MSIKGTREEKRKKWKNEVVKEEKRKRKGEIGNQITYKKSLIEHFMKKLGHNCCHHSLSMTGKVN